MDATLAYVTEDYLAAPLADPAAVGDTTVTLNVADEEDDDGILTDFSEDGGQVSIAGAIYEYETLDPLTGIMVLAAETPAITVAAGSGEAVLVLGVNDLVAGEKIAWCEWGDNDEPVPVTIPTQFAGYFTEGDVDAGAPVSIQEDGRGGYEISSRPEETAPLDGSVVWNPYVVRRMNQITVPTDSWTTPASYTDTVKQGITVGGQLVTVITPGLYDIKMQVTYVSNPTGRRYCRILVNDVIVGYGAVTGETGAQTYPSAFATVLLEPGDVIEVQTLQNSGAGLDLVTGPGLCPVSIYRVSV